jgi:putative aminopeptidase FrvX
MRTTKTVSISMPPADLRVAERLAKATSRSVSGVLREGLKRLAAEQYWLEVQAVARPKAEALGIRQSDVVRLVKEYRRQKRAKPRSKKLS